MMPFTYTEASDFDEALDILTRDGEEARVIAGGTALVNLMKQRLVQPRHLIGLRRLQPSITQLPSDGSLRLSGVTTLAAIASSPLVAQHAPSLAAACNRVATVRIRNMATLGGSLAHADPNQDPPPSLITLDARVLLRSSTGRRELPMEQLFTAYYETALAPGELIAEVVVPAQPERAGFAFLKFTPQTYDDYGTVTAAARVTVADGRFASVRVAVGAVGETPLRLDAVQSALEGAETTSDAIAHAADLTRNEVDPLTDFRGSAQYKRQMASIIVRRVLGQALASAGSASR